MNGSADARFWRHLWGCRLCRAVKLNRSQGALCQYGMALYLVASDERWMSRRSRRRTFLSSKALGGGREMEVAYL